MSVSTLDCSPLLEQAGAAVMSFPNPKPEVAAETPQPGRALRRSAFQSNGLFFEFLLTCSILLSGVAFWPALREGIADLSGSNHPHEQHSTRPYYQTLPFRLCISWAIVAGALYLRNWNEQRLRFKRLFALGAAALYNAALIVVYHQLVADRPVIGAEPAIGAEVVFSNVSEQQWPNVQCLKIIEISEPDPDAFDVREELCQRTDLHTFADFHRCVMERYASQEATMKKHWPGANAMDEKKLKTLFIMNVVSGLWSFGNGTATNKSGCVFGNEQNHWEAPPTNVRTYLEAKIGCCTDHAYLTKSLLDHEGIENRLSTIPGHIFNEVRIGGSWHVVDATTNIFLEMSWQELYERKHTWGSIDVLIFPHSNLMATKTSKYRSLAGHCRVMTLSRIANRPAHLAKTEHPDLPAYFD